MSDTTLSDGGGPGARGFGRARAGTGAVAAPRRSVRLSRTTVLRLLVLTLAAGSGYGAIQLAGNRQEQPPHVAAAPVAPPPIETEDVLVANGELTLGKIVAAEDLAWVPWPKKLIADHAIRRSATPNIREEMLGSIVRTPLLKGEPIRPEKMVKPNGSGILAAMLPSGYRAMAISIDSQGSSTAGGFILPNDRVDVIRTSTKNDLTESETLLANVRVLAIGQNIQERNGERVVTGSNATLEVDPAQAEILAQAQRSGQISLILRSMADAGAAPATVASKAPGPIQAAAPGPSMHTVNVLRGSKRQEYSVPDPAP